MLRLRTSNSSDPDLGQSANLTPPWEKGNITQVPYLDATSPSLSNAERDALPSLWAVQTNNASQTRPNMDSHARYGSNSSQRRGYAADECMVKTPLTAPPPPRPYDTPVYIPPAPKSTPYPPTFTRPPPTPPDSDLGSCTTTSASGSPSARQAEKPLPKDPPNVESNRQDRPRKASSARHSRKGGSRLQRLKAALKDMFSHHPVDERELVHIHAQGHWTDD